MASSDQPDQQTPTVTPAQEDAAAPREALIATAVRFLQNQKVRQSPVATRRAFLKKKGLTDEEVDLAIQRSGGAEDPLTVGVPGPPHASPALALVPDPYRHPGYRWRDYGALAVILAGMAFGFHHLYRKYILPLIMGSKEDKKHLRRIESSIADMSGTLTQTVTQLQSTLASVQELLVQQQKKIQDLTQELANSQASTTTNRMLESQSISELKAEIVSLKGLLLSRRQFPASPSVTKIPSWQIPLKPGSLSNPPSLNQTNSSSDISPVSNESANSSPLKEASSSQTTSPGSHCLNGEVGLGSILPLDLKDQVRMEVQGEEEKRDGEEEEDEEDDMTHADEEEHLSVQTEDRRGGDGQINEQVEKLRRPEGASNESEVD